MNGYSHHDGYNNGSGMAHADRMNANDLVVMGQEDVGEGIVGGGQSLDDIVNQNAKVIRRQSMPLSYGGDSNHVNADMRRISMMDYNRASPTGQVSGYDYDPSSPMDPSDGMAGQSPVPTSQVFARMGQSRRQSSEQLALNTNLANASQGYGAMLQPASGYTSSPAHLDSAMDMSLSSPYMDTGLGMNVDYSVDSSMTNPLSSNGMNLSMYNQPHFTSNMVGSPLDHSATPNNMTSNRAPLATSTSNGGMDTQYSGHSANSGGTMRVLSRSQSMHFSDTVSPARSANSASQRSSTGPTQQPMQQQQQTPTHQMLPQNHRAFSQQPQNEGVGSANDRSVPHGQPQTASNGLNGPPPVPTAYNPNILNLPWETPEGGWPSTMVGRPHMQSMYKNAYSSTGFDMLGVLMRVSTRPNPEIDIGAVDLSCAFVVCDAEKDDIPIVYCSDNFERLTGYTKHMILGRNCRFLQSPDGNVAPGVRRKYVDDDSVLYIKNMINMRRESQISLINYRRGGQPFMNLLTMIPISWDSEQVKFFVGFQVDLVEQPNAVTNKNADGSYSINYQRGMTMPRYVMAAPDPTPRADLGQTVSREDVSAILTTMGTGESEYAKRIWDKLLLENVDDVVHVLSLKGLFQWVSPSAGRVLEYEPSELIGTALSSVCHPSDIVPVTRELKDTSTGASVNVVFRIRRKNSGYMWFEGHGSLHTEQGKGRKSIIMVGRERPVYSLSKSEIRDAGGIGESELWTKMSTSGMFLFVASNVRQLLDRQPDELVGVSIQSLMRSESKAEFSRILEHARTGTQASVKHEMINRRGQVLSAFTTLYPGDATAGHKPTFIVAQTRLIKFARQTQPVRPSMYLKQERESSESMNTAGGGGGASSQPLSGPSLVGGGGEQTSTSAASASSRRYVGTHGAAATYAGQNGLMIGSQDVSLASDDNLFDELKTTKSSSWQYEIRQLEKRNRILAEEVQALIAAKKKRKRRKGAGGLAKDCVNCHTKVTPEWRRGPSGQRDLCNSCGLRWAKLNGRISPRTSSQHSGGGGAADADRASKTSASPHITAGLSSGGSAGGLKSESPTQPQPPPPPPAAVGHERTPDAPAAKAHEGQAGSMQGASGVPDMIEEDSEPD